jgi:2-polyprenyl-3-methyl-5-hydroxy-6-metoxy-1,4-benzoquinol methylase
MTDKKMIPSPNSYFLDKEKNVYLPGSDRNSFNYSDGDAVENELLETIQAAKDVSIGSAELINQIHDWPSRYHLSPQRVDLLRPLKHLIKGDILEIGSGCGAITRYLGELETNVTALEGSPKRAQITAARCRDLSNVSVYCDNFNDFKNDKKYDVVTLIGVLEYSPIFIEGVFAPQSMLEKIQRFLKPTGVVIIAIENQLGLKYFAGAPEDHLNKPFVGIENNYIEKGPITFGKKNLEMILFNSGFRHTEFLFPFPDYKLPSALVTEHGAKDDKLNLSDILKYQADHAHNGNFERTFDVEQSMQVIIKNKLLEDLSNSFLVVAGKNNYPTIPSNILAYTFSTQRKKEFRKLNKFIKNEDQYVVKREKIYPVVDEAQQKKSSIHHKIIDEAYIDGRSYINDLEKILKTPGWEIEQVVKWATPWLEYLKSKSKVKNNKKNDFTIPGDYLDAIPQNFIIDYNNEYIPFDLEWSSVNPLDLSYVVFRGLANSFNHYTCVAPSENFSLKIGDLSFMVLEKLLPGLVIDSSSLAKAENEFLNVALGIENVFDTLSQKSIKQEEIVQLSKIELLTETIIQLFWAGADGIFSEAKSTFQRTCLSFEKRTLSLSFHSFQDPIDYLRFDIGDKAGLLNIHSIFIKKNNGEIIWGLDIHKIEYKNNAVFVFSEEHFPGTIIQLSTTGDPYFVVHVPHIFTNCNLNELVVEIELSSLNPDQFNHFNQLINIPLSYASEREMKELRNAFMQLTVERDDVGYQLKSQKDESEHLKNNLSLLAQQVYKEENLNTDLKNDKVILGKELETKGAHIQRLQKEKDDLLEDVSKKDAIIENVERLKTELNDQLLSKEKSITDLLSETKLLEQQKKHLTDLNVQSGIHVKDLETAIEASQRSINELILDKRHIESVQSQLQKNLEEALAQNADLNLIIKTQQHHAGDLNKRIENLSGLNNDLHHENELLKLNSNKVNEDLIKKIVECKTLTKTLEELNEKMDFFVKNYENKNILQLVVNQFKINRRRS